MKLKEYFDKYRVHTTLFCKDARVNMATLKRVLDGQEIFLSVALNICDATEGLVTPWDLKAKISIPEKRRQERLGKKRVSKNHDKSIKEEPQEESKKILTEEPNGHAMGLPALSVSGTGVDQLPASGGNVPSAVEQERQQQQLIDRQSACSGGVSNQQTLTAQPFDTASQAETIEHGGEAVNL